MALTDKLTAIGDAIRVQSGKSEKLTLDQMPSEIASLQNLNFNVVGNPQPSNPTENTIWIDTDTPVTGYNFGNKDITDLRLFNRTEMSGWTGVLPNYLSSIDGNVFSFKGDFPSERGSTSFATIWFLPGVTYVVRANLAYGRIAICDTYGKNPLVGSEVDFLHILDSNVTEVTLTSAKSQFVFFHFYGDTPNATNTKPAFSTTLTVDVAEGMVQIATGTSSSAEFNAIKKNSVMVYPVSAKQYVGGAWVDKKAKIYQNGAWVELVNEFVLVDTNGVRGGYTKSGSNSTTVTVNSNNIAVVWSGGGGSSAQLSWADIDTTEYGTMEFTISGSGTSIKFSVGSAASKTVKTAGTYELDISQVSGIQTIGFNSSEASFTVTDWRLKR